MYVESQLEWTMEWMGGRGGRRDNSRTNGSGWGAVGAVGADGITVATSRTSVRLRTRIFNSVPKKKARIVEERVMTLYGILKSG